MIFYVDPGGTTGWAILEYTGSIEVTVGQLGPQEHHEQYWNMLHRLSNTGRLDRVVIEDFDNRGNKAAELTPLEYIGITKLFVQTAPWLKLDLVQPAAKEWATDQKLKDANLYHPGMRHANDACRHLLVDRCCTRKSPHFLSLLQAAARKRRGL